MASEPAILQKTSDWLAVNKPPGWLSIPGRPGPGGPLPVLSDFLSENYGKVWVIHRLDIATSGVILFARNAQAHAQASRWFTSHEARKIYHCLALGQAPVPIIKLTQPIEGLKCITQVEIKKQGTLGFLAQVRPTTGRRHQIRIHLSEAGFPIWGDVEYGGPRELGENQKKFRVERVALHASSLELPGGVKFVAPWPDDFNGWVNRVGVDPIGELKGEETA